MQNNSSLHRRLLSAGVVGIWGVLFLTVCFPCCADDTTLAQAPLVSNRPPTPIFDEATVKKMVSAIDSKHNATLLKIDYFLRRGTQPFAVEEGYKLLKSSVVLEPVGTRKWFFLQSLIGYAAFRVPGLDTKEGFAAYDILFKTATANIAVMSKPGMASTVRDAVNDYVMSVRGRLRDLGLLDDPRTAQTFSAAWIAYAAMIDIPNKARLPDPQWAEAIEYAGLQSTFDPLIDKAMGNPNTRQSYSVIRTAAFVYSYSKPQTALLLFKMAQPLLQKNDLNEAARFYKMWVNTLAPIGSTDESSLRKAIDVQRQMIADYGRGQARLLILLLRLKDEKGAAIELANLQKVNAQEGEIFDAATLLKLRAMDSIAPDIEAKSQAIALLQTYLGAKRPRNTHMQSQAEGLLREITNIKGKASHD